MLRPIEEVKFNSDLFLNSITSNYYYIGDDIFSTDFSESLLLKARSFEKKNLFRKAKVGKQINKKLRQDIRGDSIAWIDNWQGSLLHVYSFYTELLNLCKRELFLPIKRFESHFAFYPPQSFYLRHSDKHTSNPHRILSAVLYLSEWKEGYGGELILYDENAKPVTVEPKAGRIVIFDSAIEHEVTKTYKERWSLTTWFRDDILPLV